MPTKQRPTPILHIRVIGPVDQVEALLAHLARYTAITCDTPITRTTHIRTAGRAGHVRGYLTITRREAADDRRTAIPPG
jgi:hypothetical protein